MPLSAAEKRQLDRGVLRPNPDTGELDFIPKEDFDNGTEVSHEVVLTRYGKNVYDDEYEPTKYLCGDSTFWLPKGVKFCNFHSVQFMKNSGHPTRERVLTHFLCYRNITKKRNGKEIEVQVPTVIIAKKKKQDA